MTRANCWGDDAEYDYENIVNELNRYLRLKATPIGMKRFRTAAQMEAVPRIKRPDPREKMATDQIVGQCRWIGRTIGVTMDNLKTTACAGGSSSKRGQTPYYLRPLITLFDAPVWRMISAVPAPAALKSTI